MLKTTVSEKGAKQNMLVPVEISALAVDTAKGTPLVILKDRAGRVIAIPLDHSDANAIAMHTIRGQADKPLAIDLLRIAVEQLGAELYRAIISDMSEDGVFSASIVIRADRGASLKIIDCRPCDAIALAVRGGVSIFAREHVFAKQADGSGMTDGDKLREYVRSIDTVEFGKYALG